MRKLPIFCAALLLCACGGEQMTPEERALQDNRVVAMVERANDAAPPLREVTPEPLLFPDIERHDIYGVTCSYAPGTSLGARVIAREADAFMKVDGEIQRFAADPGSRALPSGTRSLYNGRQFTLRLVIVGDGAESPGGKTSYEGTVELRDPHGRIVYEGSGLTQCG